MFSKLFITAIRYSTQLDSGPQMIIIIPEYGKSGNQMLLMTPNYYTQESGIKIKQFSDWLSWVSMHAE